MMVFLRLFFLLFFLNLSAGSSPSTHCEVFFSPDGHVADHLVQLIHEEQESLHVAAYAFSHAKIAEALCDARARGVKVELIVDPFSLNFCAVKKVAQAGVPVWVWNTEGGDKRNAPLMHDKFCLFGERAVWTGSFNFTKKADHSNQENAILIRDTEIAKKFSSQFQKMRKEGCHRLSF